MVVGCATVLVSVNVTVDIDIWDFVGLACRDVETDQWMHERGTTNRK